MKQLFSLLEKVKAALASDQALKDSIASAIEEKTRIKVSPKSISLDKNGVLKLEGSPAAKSEIRLKEEAILSALAAKQIFVSRVIYK